MWKREGARVGMKLERCGALNTFDQIALSSAAPREGVVTLT